MSISLMWLLFNSRKESISWPSNVISAAKARGRVLNLTAALISLNESRHVPSLWNQMPASVVRGVHISQTKSVFLFYLVKPGWSHYYWGVYLCSLLSLWGWVCLLSHYSAKNLTLLLSKKSDIVTTRDGSGRSQEVGMFGNNQGLTIVFECIFIWVLL